MSLHKKVSKLSYHPGISVTACAQEGTYIKE